MAGRGRPRGFDREVALRQALGLFWERGYEGTSLSDLSGALGIASASIYACFGSKEGLFRETVALYGTIAGEPPWRALDEEPATRDAIAEMLRVSADAITMPGMPHGSLLVLAAPAGSAENAGVREFLAGMRRDMLGVIKARIQRGVADGELAATTDVDAITRYYTTVLQGMSVQARDGASRADLETVIECAMAAWDAFGR